MTVLWIGPLAGWASPPGTVVQADDPRVGAADADLVVIAGDLDGVDDWLRRPRTRPPVLVVAATEADEDAALRLGAEGVIGPDATPDEAARAARHARARHSRAVAGRSEGSTRYRTVVRALPDVVSRLASDGLVLDFHVPDVFKTEFPADALLGRRLHEVIPPDLAARFLDAMARLRSGEDGVSYDYQVEIAGRTHHREVRMAPADGGEVLSILRDVTALRENEALLETSQAELRALAIHLQEVREEERTRLSREVHDVLGQQLTAIRLGVGWFGRHYADDAAAQARLGDVRETIDETLRHVRQIAADLRPGVLDDFGLASAAEWQVKRFEERTGTPCSLDVHGAAEPPADVATAAFRVLQEALTNVARHANAGRVAVTLVLGPDTLRLVIADDGRGFEATRTGRRSLGLLGMHERAGALGGTLDVRGVRGQGTVVECTLPCPADTSTPTTPP